MNGHRIVLLYLAEFLTLGSIISFACNGKRCGGNKVTKLSTRIDNINAALTTRSTKQPLAMTWSPTRINTKDLLVFNYRLTHMQFIPNFKKQDKDSLFMLTDSHSMHVLIMARLKTNRTNNTDLEIGDLTTLHLVRNPGGKETPQG
jgi:hypothetical protein